MQRKQGFLRDLFIAELSFFKKWISYLFHCVQLFKMYKMEGFVIYLSVRFQLDVLYTTI